MPRDKSLFLTIWILLTMGIVQPILETMGINLVWFGIFLVITNEGCCRLDCPAYSFSLYDGVP